MAEGGGIKHEKRIHNVVHDDAIWRQTINYELNTAKNWDKSWGFVCDAYKTVDIPEKNSRLPPLKNKNYSQQPNASGLPSKLCPGLTKDANSLISDWLLTYDTPRIVNYRFPASKYTYPATTSNEVGWPWGRNSQYGNEEPAKKKIDNNDNQFQSKPTKNNFPPLYYTLERFGNHARGKQENLKWFGGSLEGLN
ncbi:hypothetical protein HDU92_004731 [Lobulomyces angularis]|nr:hypothetical protein HDU92_004731 [Lobulomyces angularis]